MASTKSASRTETVLSRRQVEGLIADGRSIVILDHRVLKVDAWMKYHPGGDKAILHMVGRDATDEVNGLVRRSYCHRTTSLTILATGSILLKPANKWNGIELEE